MNLTHKITPERILPLNDKPILRDKKYIIYRMQSSVRTVANLALYKALQLARENNLQLRVVFHLEASFPEANLRHFRFLAEGINDVAIKFSKMGINFDLLYAPFEEAMEQLKDDMAVMVTDTGYLRFHRLQREWLIANLKCSLISVEDNLCVPIESASHKQEWAARTLRPKVMGKLEYFMSDSSITFTSGKFAEGKAITPDPDKLSKFIESIARTKPLSPGLLSGGETVALRLLDIFVTKRLANYDADRNHPELSATSHLSPYLHFGMISPITIIKAVKDSAEAAPFVEQLVVRRELAHNFIYYCNDYDSYSAIPEWARNTLKEHLHDNRPVLYSADQFENASTHDHCWNASMHQLSQTGFMENTMRMYWGKKIIEWSASPEEAFHTMSYLNNKYQLDGRDANSWAGIGWCFGLHDRPWQRRDIFGTVRFMNEAGLRRKYDMERYINMFGG